MNIAQLLQTCLRSILRNRMRSLLTSLGVIIGVASVIVMVALGEGTQREVEMQLSEMGTNLLMIYPRRGTGRTGQQRMMRVSGFTKEDIQKLKTESSYIAAITGEANVSGNVVGPEGSSQMNIMGVEPDYQTVRNHNVDAGYFFEEEDLYYRTAVAVLGRTTAQNLFGNADAALGQQIRINNIYFTVIGLLKIKGAGFGGYYDDVILIPLETAMTRFSARSIGVIYISVVDKNYMSAAQKETELILRESRKIQEGVPSDFEIMNQAEFLDMVEQTSRSFTMLLASIAGVSLLVGGIGIMNIMLVSVTERTREIGIRMAVGGRKRDIMFQFLTESIILSLMGGILGIVMSFLACRIMATMNIPTVINPLIIAVSTVFAAVVGIIFGYYPALKAARLYPIDALRYE